MGANLDYIMIDRGTVPNKATGKWHWYLRFKDGVTFISTETFETSEEAGTKFDIWCAAMDKVKAHGQN